LTGVPYSTLNLWAKNGLVKPSVALGTGSGNERVYSFSDLVALKVAFELRKAGVTTKSLKKVVEFLREKEALDRPLANARLVVSGRDILVVKNSNELVSALSQPGQGCLSFVVDLPRTLGQLIEIAETKTTFAVGLARDLRPSRRAETSKLRKRA
jgi:DNA-binding transcriptional MerR regulator